MEDRYDDKYLMLSMGCCAQKVSYKSSSQEHNKRRMFASVGLCIGVQHHH